MEIGFYGRIGDRLGRARQLDVPAEVTTVGALRAFLASTWPEAADELGGSSLRACVDDEIVSEDHPITGCRKVEFFPPLSGG